MLEKVEDPFETLERLLGGLSFFDFNHGAVALAERLIYVGSDESVREAVESEGGRARPLG